MDLIKRIKSPLPARRRAWCTLATLSLLTIMAVTGCADGEAAGQPEGTEEETPVDVEQHSEALTSSHVICGRDSVAFPSWAGAGETTLDIHNELQANTSIHLEYHAGLGGHVYVDVPDHRTATGHWWGAWVWVTYLGWWGPDGRYHPCIMGTQNTGSPSLYVQSY